MAPMRSRTLLLLGAIAAATVLGTDPAFAKAAEDASAPAPHTSQNPRCKSYTNLDAYAAAPLFAAMAFMPRMGLKPTLTEHVCHQVTQRKLTEDGMTSPYGPLKELHMRMGNRQHGCSPYGPNNYDVSTPSAKSGSNISPAQLHNMAVHDGYVEAMAAGVLHGFNLALEKYNKEHEQEGCVQLILKQDKVLITDFGLAIGSTHPDQVLVYHKLPGGGEAAKGKPHQLQDPNNHVWLYFAAEKGGKGKGGKADVLYMDFGSFAYGMGLQMDISPYVPAGTEQHSALMKITRGRPGFGAPGVALTRRDVKLIDNSEMMRKKGYTTKHKLLNEHARISVSKMARDAAQKAEADGAEPNPLQLLEDLLFSLKASIKREQADYDEQQQEAKLQSSASRYIPFRDGPLKEALDAAVLFSRIAYNNTMEVLKSQHFKHYPPEFATALAPWASEAHEEQWGGKVANEEL